MCTDFQLHARPDPSAASAALKLTITRLTHACWPLHADACTDTIGWHSLYLVRCKSHDNESTGNTIALWGATSLRPGITRVDDITPNAPFGVGAFPNSKTSYHMNCLTPVRTRMA